MAALDENARKLLEGKNFAFLATINKDGSPQVTPTWVDTDGKNVLINTALGRKKAENTSRDPRVAVGIVDQANAYQRVSIQGRVVKRVEGSEADDHIDKMSLKYTGNAKYSMRAPGEKRVILVIEPLRLY